MFTQLSTLGMLTQDWDAGLKNGQYRVSGYDTAHLSECIGCLGDARRLFVAPEWVAMPEAWDAAHEEFALRFGYAPNVAPAPTLEDLDPLFSPSEYATTTEEVAAITEGTPVPDAKLAKLRAIIDGRRAAETRVEVLQSRITALESDLSTARYSQITDYTDERLTKLWDDAHEAANNRGYCEVYDQICEDIGAPGRVKTLDVTLVTNVTFTVSVQVNGSSPDESDIRRAIRDNFSSYDLAQNVDVDSVDDWSIEDWEEAEN